MSDCKYRNINIKRDTFGSFSMGGRPKTLDRYIAKLNNKTLRGTLDEVKRKIDEELGPEVADPGGAGDGKG